MRRLCFKDENQGDTVNRNDVLVQECHHNPHTLFYPTKKVRCSNLTSPYFLQDLLIWTPLPDESDVGTDLGIINLPLSLIILLPSSVLDLATKYI